MRIWCCNFSIKSFSLTAVFVSSWIPAFRKSLFFFVAAVFFHQLKLSFGAKLRPWLGPNQFFQGLPPSPRKGHSFVSVPKCGLYVFGGYGGRGNLNDLHHCDPDAMVWTDMTTRTQGTPPTPRSGHGMAFVDNDLFVFGGDGNQGSLNDLHRLDLSTITWSHIPTAATVGAPVAVSGSGGAELVPRSLMGFAAASVAGGNGYALYLLGGSAGSASGNLADLHRMLLPSPTSSLLVAAWEDLTDTVAGPRPLPRNSLGLAAAPAAAGDNDGGGGGDGCVEVLYLFGGASAAGNLGDLFVLVQNTSATSTNLRFRWEELGSRCGGAVPSERSGHGLAAWGRDLYVFGGHHNGVLNDVFRLDLDARHWHDLGESAAVAAASTSGLVSALQPPPPPRKFAGFVVATSSRDGYGGSARLFVFAGSTGSALLNDFYSFDIPPLPETNASASSPTSSSTLLGSSRFSERGLGWALLGGALSGTPPGPREFSGMAGLDGDVYVFGGVHSGVTYNDLYRLDVTRMRWENLTGPPNACRPPPVQGHGLVGCGHRLFTFGGFRMGNVGDFYSYNLATTAWKDLSAGPSYAGSPPSKRNAFGIAAHGSDAFFIFGGRAGPAPAITMGDLHWYNCSAMVWEELTMRTSGSQPSPRFVSGLSSVSGGLYVFGGINAAGNLGDLYRLDLKNLTWAELTASAGLGPPARRLMGMAASSDRFFVFGGSNTALFNDFFQFNARNLTWTDLSSASLGTLPSPRSRHGVAFVRGFFFIFGGLGNSGDLEDLSAITVPATLAWPARGSAHRFTSVHDWDSISIGNAALATKGMEVHAKTTLRLDFPVLLCQLVFPCSLVVDGLGASDSRPAKIFRQGQGRISCLQTNGCHQVSLASLQLVCQDNEASVSAIEVQSASLSLKRVTISACQSAVGNGGAVSLLGGATAIIESSEFHGTKSSGSGGAISVVGSHLFVSRTRFDGCYAADSGGAVWISANRCVGPLSTSTSNTASAHLTSCKFVGCAAGASGGALAVSGSPTSVRLTYSQFVQCSAGGTGGAISVNDGSALEAVRCSFRNCSAHGAGGGAVLTSNGALVTLVDTTLRGNTAPAGGGGALLWQGGGTQPLLVSWCPPGTYSRMIFGSSCGVSRMLEPCAPSCVMCGAGTYQTGQGSAREKDCQLCPPGFYSVSTGATACSACSAGKFLSIVGSTSPASCKPCTAGTRSAEGALTCLQCEPGSYSPFLNATVCIDCSVGTFLVTRGETSSAACSACAPGSYAKDTGVSACAACTPSMFAEMPGASTCISCAPGKSVRGGCVGQTFAIVPAGFGSMRDVNGMMWVARLVLVSPPNTCDVPINAAEVFGSVALLVVNPYCQIGTQSWKVQQAGSVAIIITNFQGEALVAPGGDNGDRVVIPVGMITAIDGDRLRNCSSAAAAVNETDGLVVAGLVTPTNGFNLQVISIWNANASNDPQAVYRGQLVSESLSCSFCPLGTFASTSGARACSNCIPGTFSHAGASICFICNSSTQNALSDGTACAANSKEIVSPSHVSASFNFKKNLKDNLADPFRSKTGYVLKSISKKLIIWHHTLEVIPHSLIPLKGGSYLQPAAQLRNVISSAIMSSTTEFYWDGEGFDQSICDTENSATYGNCVASDYRSLAISEEKALADPNSPRYDFGTVSDSPIVGYGRYAGITFSMTVVKLDAFNQIVIADSASVLQVVCFGESINVSGTLVVPKILGGGIAPMQAGRANFNLTLSPVFAQVDFASHTAKLLHQLVLRAQGDDALKDSWVVNVSSSLNGPGMQSRAVSVGLREGAAVCPRGYVLILDFESVDSESTNGHNGVCKRCSSGAYSIDPLATPVAGAAPACMPCPTGGNCVAGGDDVKFAVGSWEADHSRGIFVLRECPPGYHLVNTSNAEKQDTEFSHVSQQCLNCMPGKYILPPGLSPCQECPEGARCPDGVYFEPKVTGSVWEPMDGIYHLRKCPAGTQLLNSTEGTSRGTFSKTIQQCRPCAPGQYIVDPDVDDCQDCPLGALCTGGNFTSKILGSIWSVVSGVYRLFSCPPGYELNQVSQFCELCTAGFYCVGGVAGRAACPDGLFSGAGSNSSTQCTSVVFVMVEVALGMRQVDFSPEVQRRFLQALADESLVSVDRILVQSIEQSRRSTSSTSRRSQGHISSTTALKSFPHRFQRTNGQDGMFEELVVVSRAAASDVQSAEKVIGTIDDVGLKNELKKQGLSAGMLLSKVVIYPAESGVGNTKILILAVSITSALLFLVAAAAVSAAIWALQIRPETMEEALMRLKVREIRQRLHITAGDGYILPGERPPSHSWWPSLNIWPRGISIVGREARRMHAEANQTVQLRRGQIEAAARLELHSDYDLHQFDAFCLFLEGEANILSWPPSEESRFEENIMESTAALIGCSRYDRLCDWLLDVCHYLLRPDIPATDDQLHISNQHPAADRQSSTDIETGTELSLGTAERFKFFTRRVMKARIWMDSPQLFHRLQTMAERFMEDIAVHGDRRFQRIKLEAGGIELIQIDESLILGQGTTSTFGDFGKKDGHQVQGETAVSAAELQDPPNQAANLLRSIHRVDISSKQRIIARQDDEVVRAIVVSEEAKLEQEAANYQSELANDEGVFLEQLRRRAILLNSSFQRAVIEVVRRHEVPSLTAQDPLESSGTIRLTESSSIHHSRSSMVSAELDPRTRPAFPGQASSAVRERRPVSNPPQRMPSDWMRLESLELSSTGAGELVHVDCLFRNNGFGSVDVQCAAVKSMSRMAEKVMEYTTEALPWPRAASILDPIRVSVICNGPAHMVEAAHWFIQDSSRRVGNQGASLQACRLKNKFAFAKEDLVGGYRDLMICVVCHGTSGLAIVGEVQIQDRELFDLKTKMHKLYKICRASSPANIC